MKANSTKAALFVIVLTSLSACGYHVAGKADLMPATVHTIAVPQFTNATIRYKLSQFLTADVAREFITRTRYKVLTDPNQSDAVLKGSVLIFNSYPIVLDQASGRATAVQVNLVLNVTLTERKTGKVLFIRPYFEVHERYQVAIDPTTYFDESGAGMERLSHDVARDIVTSILENF
jgi:outer membrane lipopolysaccharide assembly protein LptE/RlpB